MTEIEPSPELAQLFTQFEERGGVLEFALYEKHVVSPISVAHREAARAFLDECAKVNRERLKQIDLTEYPLAGWYTFKWDESKLLGRQISFAEFWGTDEISSTSARDGYKPAFFLPPQYLRDGIAGNVALFESINSNLFGDTDRSELEIWSWATDCSSYFDGGREWWGAFLWTISRPGDKIVIVIVADATD